MKKTFTRSTGRKQPVFLDEGFANCIKFVALRDPENISRSMKSMLESVRGWTAGLTEDQAPKALDEFPRTFFSF